MDAAENDGAGFDFGRGTGELEAVAREVGQFLDLALLIIVGKNRGVLLSFERGDFVEDVRHGRIPCFLCGGGQPTSSI